MPGSGEETFPVGNILRQPSSTAACSSIMQSTVGKNYNHILVNSSSHAPLEFLEKLAPALFSLNIVRTAIRSSAGEEKGKIGLKKNEKMNNKYTKRIYCCALWKTQKKERAKARPRYAASVGERGSAVD